MKDYKNYCTEAEIESYNSEELVEIVGELREKNDKLGLKIGVLKEENRQLKLVEDLHRKALDKSNACLKAVSAVLEMMDET